MAHRSRLGCRCDQAAIAHASDRLGHCAQTVLVTTPDARRGLPRICLFIHCAHIYPTRLGHAPPRTHRARTGPWSFATGFMLLRRRSRCAIRVPGRVCIRRLWACSDRVSPRVWCVGRAQHIGVGGHADGRCAALLPSVPLARCVRAGLAPHCRPLERTAAVHAAADAPRPISALPSAGSHRRRTCLGLCLVCAPQRTGYRARGRCTCPHAILRSCVCGATRRCH